MSYLRIISGIISWTATGNHHWTFLQLMYDLREHCSLVFLQRRLPWHLRPASWEATEAVNPHEIAIFSAWKTIICIYDPALTTQSTNPSGTGAITGRDGLKLSTGVFEALTAGGLLMAMIIGLPWTSFPCISAIAFWAISFNNHLHAVKWHVKSTEHLQVSRTQQRLSLWKCRSCVWQYAHPWVCQTVERSRLWVKGTQN